MLGTKVPLYNVNTSVEIFIPQALYLVVLFFLNTLFLFYLSFPPNFYP